MSIDTYNQTQGNININPDTMPSAEKEAHIEIAQQIVRESIGTVAISSSMDLNPAEQDSLVEAIERRVEYTGTASSGYVKTELGGWGDYGERKLDQATVAATEFSALTEEVSDHNRYGEFVQFAINEDGTTDVRYRYGDYNWKDGSGRPGTSITMSFNLPGASASALKQQLETNPSLINEVIRQQWIGVGLDENRLSAFGGPKNGPVEKYASNQDTRKLAVFSIDEGSQPRIEILNYADAEPLATPEVHPSAELPEQNAEYIDIDANIAAKEARESVKKMLEEGASKAKILQELQIVADQADSRANEATSEDELIKWLSRRNGYDTVIYEVESELAEDQPSQQTTESGIQTEGAYETQSSPEDPRDKLSRLSHELDALDRLAESDDAEEKVFNDRDDARSEFMETIADIAEAEGVRSIQNLYEQVMNKYVAALAEAKIPLDEMQFPAYGPEADNAKVNMAMNELLLINEALEFSENEYSKDGTDKLLQQAKRQF